METWFKAICQNCDKANWLCNGDVQDQTVPDIEGFMCWYCGWHYKFTDDGSVEEWPDEDMSSTPGLEAPR